MPLSLCLIRLLLVTLPNLVMPFTSSLLVCLCLTMTKPDQTDAPSITSHHLSSALSLLHNHRRRARTRVEKAVDRVAQLYRRQAGLPLVEGCKVSRRSVRGWLMEGWVLVVGVHAHVCLFRRAPRVRPPPSPCNPSTHTNQHHQTIEGEWQAFLASLPPMALPSTEGGAHFKAEYERTLSPVVASLLLQARKMVSEGRERRALVCVCMCMCMSV